MYHDKQKIFFISFTNSQIIFEAFGFFFLAVGVKRLFLKIVLLMNFFYIIN